MHESALRIMLLVNEFPPEKVAGTAMATRALAENLSARGHAVCVVVTTACPEEKLHLVESGAYELVWMRPRPFRGSGFAWRVWQALREARRFRPQVIQGQAVSCGLLAAMVGRVMHVPSICYAQGYDVYQASPLQRLTEIRWGCLWPDRLLAVTRHLADSIRLATGVSTALFMPHAFTLPAHLPGREAARSRCGMVEGERWVMNIGRLETFKGHDVLLEAWADVVVRHPEARLAIAGSGSCLDSLQRQVREGGLEASVCFLGHLTAIEVHQWMAASDLFVLPSRSEPFGIVLLEAMAHGLPVVASRVGGVPEVLPEAGHVQLVASENVRALSSAMASVLDADFASSEINRQHAMGFEWYQQVRKFESLYFQLVAGDDPEKGA